LDERNDYIFRMVQCLPRFTTIDNDVSLTDLISKPSLGNHKIGPFGNQILQANTPCTMD